MTIHNSSFYFQHFYEQEKEQVLTEQKQMTHSQNRFFSRTLGILLKFYGHNLQFEYGYTIGQESISAIIKSSNLNVTI